MTKRDDWNFSYLGSDLATAAGKKMDFHRGRLKFWTDKKAEVMTAIKADGLEIDESIASESPKFSSANYGRDPVVAVRADLLRDLRECVSKISEHRKKLDGYHGWRQILQANSNISQALDHDDWLFFFGEPVDVTEVEGG